jgi:hypothetical protein
MIWRQKTPDWVVEVKPSAIRKAQMMIESHYQGVGRKDMERWLARFLDEVHKDPLDVLGNPPLQAASDPELIYFPADPSRKISGLAHARKYMRRIVVYDILVQSPKAQEGRHER